MVQSLLIRRFCADNKRTKQKFDSKTIYLWSFERKRMSLLNILENTKKTWLWLNSTLTMRVMGEVQQIKGSKIPWSTHKTAVNTVDVQQTGGPLVAPSPPACRWAQRLNVTAFSFIMHAFCQPSVDKWLFKHWAQWFRRLQNTYR